MTNIMCHPERNAVSKALRVILSEATLVAKSKDLGGPARSLSLPKGRHALFCGAPLRLAARAPLTKPSLAPLAVIPAHHHVIPAQAGISLLAPQVSALACYDRCREIGEGM